ncbi:MAG: MBL fold metallo-hydrolase [Bacteroidota bacterium]
MTHVAKFVFSPFQENTYVLYDDTKECIIMDPGCQEIAEKQMLREFIESNGLKPVRLILTHCHIDHIFGNRFVYETWGLKPEIHKDELPVLEFGSKIAEMYGLRYEPSPEPAGFLSEADVVEFGESRLEILFTPGHSPASLSFYCKDHDFIISGDVLFSGSIGRTDLPGGSFETLSESIRTQLYTLDDKTKVYSGHGPETTIGFEKINNPFVKG